jgi:hypothetical protein
MLHRYGGRSELASSCSSYRSPACQNAFWLLMRMMKGYSLERLYPSLFTVMSECFTKFDQLLQLYHPEVYTHLHHTLGVASSFYVQQWFQTVFLYSQRLELALRVVDLMIVRKVEALFAVGLSIVAHSEGTNGSFIQWTFSHVSQRSFYPSTLLQTLSPSSEPSPRANFPREPLSTVLPSTPTSWVN